MIRLLPARLANQIAAGEVVERPASVVKELIENSIDAGATDIHIAIEKGGYKRILVRDNGSGIPKDELALALSRHATSKIESIDDLEAITSLGFRGEALASMSSVSRLVLTAKPSNQQQAWQAHCEGRDMQIQLNPTAHPDGCSVEVVDLFFNTPARRKFLKTEKTEFQHIEEVFKRIALSHPSLSFSLKHNAKSVFKLVKCSPENFDRRLEQICGQAFMKNAHKFENEFEYLSVTGWCIGLGEGWKTNNIQYCFINGRMIRDKVIQHAIRQAFEGLINPQSFPAYVIFLKMPASKLDINVHPAKHEVRFHEARVVHDFVFQSVNTSLLSSANNNERESSFEDKHIAVSEFKHDYLADNEDRSYVAPLNSSSRAKSTPKISQSHRHSHRSGNQTEAKLYQSLISSSQDLQNPDSKNRLLPQSCFILPNNRIIYGDTDKLYYIEAERLLAGFLEKQGERSTTSQPLLMPVSVKSEPFPLEQFLEQSKFECTRSSSKLILKKVPSYLRSISWASVFPKLVEWLSTRTESNQLKQAFWEQCAIALCELQTYDLEEVGDWLKTLGSDQVAKLFKSSAVLIDIPSKS